MVVQRTALRQQDARVHVRATVADIQRLACRRLRACWCLAECCRGECQDRTGGDRGGLEQHYWGGEVVFKIADGFFRVVRERVFLFCQWICFLSLGEQGVESMTSLY